MTYAEIFIPIKVIFRDGKPVSAAIADDAPWMGSDSTDDTKWAPDPEDQDPEPEYTWLSPTEEESREAEAFLAKLFPHEP